ncbi:MAG: hypothetical protein SPH79_07555 [Schaalia hyovaginalis]|uniref:hypothetical protein n=1 Tax=Schaalia hyovaginalis TaxID=29316 RepID=UPI002A91CEAB|nr:hypothetical protein [Schaalia hyovaginalis]MDY6214329.1 hypothetical protein [Schaalia hyovaginalis]
MTTESGFDTESVSAASNALDSQGASAISIATGKSTGVLSCQTPAKWGTEQGPSTFSPRYSEYLSFLEREMATMRDQLASFIASIRQTARAIENNETDIHDAFQRISADLEEQPDAPTKPYGRSSHENPTTAPESEATPVSASTQRVASSSGYSAIGRADGTGA